MHVDDSFARLALLHIQKNQPKSQQMLLDHPALDVLIRHQKMTGVKQVDRTRLLQRLLNTVDDVDSTTRVIDFWSKREKELSQSALCSLRYLPAHIHLNGTVYLIIGYDIGIAAPPDVAINVGHVHFRKSPKEVGYYATHEAHHAGFLSVRPFPPININQLENPAKLKSLIMFITQMEGMAVHAAFPDRQRNGDLEMDQDYRIYYNPEAASQVVIRYKQIWKDLQRSDKLESQKVGSILNAMSSGKRLWYHFGALVAWTIEREQGIERLIESVEKPEIFSKAVKDILTRRSFWK
jgi:hypothetical protein